MPGAEELRRLQLERHNKEEFAKLQKEGIERLSKTDPNSLEDYIKKQTVEIMKLKEHITSLEEQSKNPEQSFKLTFNKGDRVRYIPNHANGDPHHTDCEDGVVKSTNDLYAFVLYDIPDQIMITGDEPYTAKATSFKDLVHIDAGILTCPRCDYEFFHSNKVFEVCPKCNSEFENDYHCEDGVVKGTKKETSENKKTPDEFDPSKYLKTVQESFVSRKKSKK